MASKTRAAVFSLIIPVYRNEDSIPFLVETLEELNRCMGGDLEAVLVVDGSPDRSLELLGALLPNASFSSQLLVLSRNFGAFPAITAGLASARGSLFATMAADLQDPPELIVEIRHKLETGEYDVVVGTRAKRDDPLVSRALSATFWKLYKLLVQSEIPSGGVDVFGGTREFREHLLALPERNAMLVGLIFWLGFRRGEVSYSRGPRRHGQSAWSFTRKVRYVLDSTFAFSDLPVRLLSLVGLLGVMLSVLLAGAVVFAKWSGRGAVPGYSAAVLLIMFFGGLNSLGLGLIGEYVWRTFENTKGRPVYVIAQHREYEGKRSLNTKQRPLSIVTEHIGVAQGSTMTEGPDGVFVHPLGVCESRQVGRGTRVWAFAHVLPGARIGSDCNVCDGVFIENDVVIGDRVTIKNGVQLWDGVTLEDDVFVGPNATFSNDSFPRSKQRPPAFLTTVVKRGASIGANATLLPGIAVGQAAMIGAGAVVTRDVPPRAIVVGNPGRIVGYAGMGV